MEPKEQILTWKDTVHIIAPGLQVYPGELSELITLARQKNIGRPISYQKTAYSALDLEILGKIIKWWMVLDSFSNIEWRNSATSKLIQERVIQSVKTDEQVIFFSIFCPSYKVGNGAYGYNPHIGNHTKELIKKFSDFISDSKNCGLNVKGIAYFSDLLLENLEKLKGIDYKSDLNNNYRSFCTEFRSKCDGNIETPLLSSVKECIEEVGEVGISLYLSINPDIYRQVLDRNAVFYKEKLGWGDEEIKHRTDVIIGTYLKLAEIFNKKYPTGINVWVESAYERGLLYGCDPLSAIPVIYPKKNG